jgi:hypothetical protein
VTKVNTNRNPKTEILILINMSKELAYYSDFKYISFIYFSITLQRPWAWENLLEKFFVCLLFSRKGLNFLPKYFQQGELSMGKVSGRWNLEGKFYTGGFARTPKQNSFYLFYFSLCRPNLTRGDVTVIFWDKFLKRLNCLDVLFGESRDFSVEVEPDFLVLKKWNKIKKVFFYLKVRLRSNLVIRG